MNPETPADTLLITFLIIGSASAMILIVALAIMYAYVRRRRAMRGASLFGPKSSRMKKLNGTADRLALNRDSIYKSGIWQSIDLGRNRQITRDVTRTPASFTPLDGYEAASNGYDPDARRIDLMADDADIDREQVVEFEEAKKIVPDEDEFYHQMPEPAHGAIRVHVAAPSPLYSEFAAGEKWS